MDIQQRPADHVGVHLTDCDPKDAAVVFGALASVFPATTETVPATTHHHPTDPTVWVTDFDAGKRSGPSRPAGLAGTVTADLFGCDSAVRRVRETLLSSFVAEDEGVIVPGDGEVEVRVRLAAS